VRPRAFRYSITRSTPSGIVGAATTSAKSPLRSVSLRRSSSWSAAFLDVVAVPQQLADGKLAETAGIIARASRSEYVALELPERHPPERRRVVRQLRDHASGIRVLLLLHLDEAEPAGVVHQQQVGGAGGELGLVANRDHAAEAEIRRRHERGVAPQDVMEHLL
jgi:hypothetical protein